MRSLLAQATLAAIEGRLQPLRQEAVSEAVSRWLASVAATVQVGRTPMHGDHSAGHCMSHCGSYMLPLSAFVPASRGRSFLNADSNILQMQRLDRQCFLDLLALRLGTYLDVIYWR